MKYIITVITSVTFGSSFIMANSLPPTPMSGVEAAITAEVQR